MALPWRSAEYLDFYMPRFQNRAFKDNASGLPNAPLRFRFRATQRISKLLRRIRNQPHTAPTAAGHVALIITG